MTMASTRVMKLVNIDPFAIEVLLGGLDQTWGTREAFCRRGYLRF